jgi:hypothetical protein
MDAGHGILKEIRTTEEIARSLREEFGVGIDAHPGSASNEAGQINRAFRVVSEGLLRGVARTNEELPGLLTSVLREVAKRALIEAGIPTDQAGLLLDLEPVLGNQWYAYLALAPLVVLQDLLEG